MKFETGKNYKGHFIGNGKEVSVNILKRTDKTVTINDLISGEVTRCKVHLSDGVEFFYPLNHIGLTINA